MELRICSCIPTKSEPRCSVKGYSPAWPWQEAYVYTKSRPTVLVDYFGLQPRILRGDPHCPNGPGQRPDGNPACSSDWNRYIYCYCNAYNSLGPPFSDTCDSMGRQYYDDCYHKGKKHPPHWGLPWAPPHSFPFQPAPGGGEVAPYPIWPGQSPLPCKKPIWDPITGLPNCWEWYQNCLIGGGILRSAYCTAEYILCHAMESYGGM